MHVFVHAHVYIMHAQTHSHMHAHVCAHISAASHQTFSKHLTSQTKYGQKNLLYIINGELLSFSRKANIHLDNLQSLS